MTCGVWIRRLRSFLSRTRAGVLSPLKAHYSESSGNRSLNGIGNAKKPWMWSLPVWGWFWSNWRGGSGGFLLDPKRCFSRNVEGCTLAVNSNVVSYAIKGVMF